VVCTAVHECNSALQCVFMGVVYCVFFTQGVLHHKQHSVLCLYYTGRGVLCLLYKGRVALFNSTLYCCIVSLFHWAWCIVSFLQRACCTVQQYPVSCLLYTGLFNSTLYCVSIMQGVVYCVFYTQGCSTAPCLASFLHRICLTGTGTICYCFKARIKSVSRCHHGSGRGSCFKKCVVNY